MNDSTPYQGEATPELLFKKRLGLALCGLYALAYCGFVFLAVHDVTLMDTVMLFGLNLAAFYGLGLIVLALVLAMIYSVACNRRENAASTERRNG